MIGKNLQIYQQNKPKKRKRKKDLIPKVTCRFFVILVISISGSICIFLEIHNDRQEIVHFGEKYSHSSRKLHISRI